MNSAINKDIAKIFSYKSLIVLLAVFFILLTMFCSDFIGVFDSLLIYPVIIIGLLASIFIFKKSMDFPTVPYLILQLIFIWIFFDQKLFSPFGISVKPHALALGFGLLVAAYYLFKDFKYLWANFPYFRYLLIFFGINLIYLFFYHTSFRLSEVIAGYHVAFAEKFSDENAGNIMFLVSLCTIVPTIISLMIFKNVNDIRETEKKIISVIKYLLYGFIAYFSMAVLMTLIGLNQIVFKGNRLSGDFLGAPGIHVILSLFLILFIGFKYYLNNQKSQKVSELTNILLNLFIIVNLVFILLMINKTTIAALAFTLIFYILVSFKMGINLNLKQDERNIISSFISIVPFIILAFLVMANIDFVSTSLNNIIGRFSSSSTLNVRLTNWHYLIVDWLDKLNLFKFLFGFGLGASRESIFYISAMQPSGHLVQTVHNHFIEMFYDYGLVAFLYFGALISVITNSVKILIRKDNVNIKIFSLISLSLIIFFFMYGLTDGIRVPNAVIFFNLVGLLESFKHGYLSNYGEHNEN